MLNAPPAVRCLPVAFPNSYVQIVPRGTDDTGIIATIKERLGPV